jgi:hypothetical protein
MTEKKKTPRKRKKKVEKLDLAKLEIVRQELRAKFERELVNQVPSSVFESDTYKQLQQVDAQIAKLRGEEGGKQ